ncbi:MAG: hypoxanthine phosphoribosyltransferase, partial [Bacteriovoracaceae bacterium]|nr:hypoxanthine phosphoribosyltransferase [Bacteriovoracaceae bacterium]
MVVEDIVDTGLTLTGLMKDFKQRDPKNLKLASLLFKPARCKHKVHIDYLG